MDRTYHMYWVVDKNTQAGRSIIIDVKELEDANNRPSDFVAHGHEITEDYGLVTVQGRDVTMLGNLMEETL